MTARSRPSLFPGSEGFPAPGVLLEDRLEPEHDALLYGSPVSIVRCDEAEGLDDAFRAIEAGLASGLHAAGLFSFELGYLLEPKLVPLLPPRSGTPLLWFGLFDAPRAVGSGTLDEFFASLAPPPPLRNVRFDESEEHGARVRDALRLIEAGDIYQVNLTFPLDFRSDGDPLALYAAMRTRQPVSHGGVAAIGDLTVLSVSPELWISITGDRATTRPMKGTVARGATAFEDEAAKAAIRSDPKQLAENLMIVDLLRNDLSRVSVPGTVRVPELFAVESYPTLHAMTSTITSRLEPGRSLRERVTALFPCGSVVGVPKIRAGEVIRTLERSPRGFYTGALGSIAPNGDMRFNVAIRTAVVDRAGVGRYGVGGGIVAESDPAGEYAEAMLKASILRDLAEEYGLIETLRWSAANGFVRLDRHLARVEGSARTLGFAFDPDRVLRRLRVEASAWRDAAADRRVRMVLTRDGAVDVTERPADAADGRLRIGLARERLDPGDPFLRHKTTRRGVYERAFSEAQGAGFDEAILLNRRGEVAEASRHTVFVECEGRLATPPLTCGVLPGVLRACMLDEGTAIERTLTPDMLVGRPVWLGNSLNGLRPAVLAT